VLALLALVPVLTIAVAGPPLFDFVFGSEWERAGQYAQWLVVWWFFGFVNVPAIMLIHTFGMQHLLFGYEVVQALARVGAIALGAHLGDDLTAIMLFAGVGAVFNATLVAFMFWYTRTQIRDASREESPGDKPLSPDAEREQTE
jgi:O-antigen/teichoic acid export membrane protein